MRITTNLLLLLLLAPTAAAPAAGAQAGDGVRPAQVWRLASLTLEQRRRLHALQMSAFREARDMAGDRREAAARLRELRDQVARVVTPAQLEEARRMPGGPLAPEELIYYPITALAGLDPARRAKIDAVFRPALERARREAGGWRGRGGADGAGDAAGEPERERRRGAERQRRLAYYEVLDALLTTEQMATVNGFLPGHLRKVGLKERVVYRLPSLTLEQEARARAVFAALEDETGADRARLKAIGAELRGGAREARRALQSERREVARRVDAREQSAYAELARLLTPEQLRELEAQRPGPPRPTVFVPKAIAQLALAPEQRRRLRAVRLSFERETRDERRELRALRAKAQGADLQSMEMAATRDSLRRAAEVVDDAHERATREIADTLTAEQIARLVEIATKEN